MAFTQLDLDNMDKALASGKRQVQINYRMIQYQTISDMMRVRAMIVKDLESQKTELTGKRRKKCVRYTTRNSWRR